MNFLSTFLTLATLALLAVGSDAKKGKKNGPTSKSMGPAKKKGPGKCTFPGNDVLEGVLLGVVATLNAGDCALDTAEALCSGVTKALDRCNEDSKSCFCELAQSELVESFDEGQCVAELLELSSNRRQLASKRYIILIIWLI